MANNTFGSDPSSQNTTFVQADPSTFRTVVQKLTGAPPQDPPAQKRPAEMGPRKPAFKRKLQVTLTRGGAFGFKDLNSGRGFGGEMVSPVSTLDFLTARGSHEEQEQREKGFYLHPSPRAAPRVAEPELLLLFPLRSPRDNSNH